MRLNLLDTGGGGGVGLLTGGLEEGEDGAEGVGEGGVAVLGEVGIDSDGPESCFSASSTGISVE